MRLGPGQIALILHQPDDQVGAVLRAAQIAGRRIGRRRLEQSGQHRGLGRIDDAGGLAEIALACGLETKGACAQIGAVQIDGQNIVLGVFQLHRDRHRDFFQLALEPRQIREIDAFRDLLRNRGAAVALERATAFAQVDANRTQNAPRRHAEMPEIALVLGRHHRVAQMRRYGFRRHEPAELVAAPGKDIALVVQHRDRAVFPRIHQFIGWRQLQVIVTDGRAQHQNPDHGRPRKPPPNQAAKRTKQPAENAATRFGYRPLAFRLGCLCL